MHDSFKYIREAWLNGNWSVVTKVICITNLKDWSNLGYL